MKLRYITIFSILCILITPILPIKEKSSDHIFSAKAIGKTSGNQDGRNITNALSISPGNTFNKELEAYETIYFCTSWQENISCDISSNTPQSLSCFLLSDAGQTLNCQKKISNNKIKISYYNPSDSKGQYIFIKISNEKNTNQKFQLKLYSTSPNLQKTEPPKNNSSTPKTTTKPKNNISTSKTTTKPKNNISIPKATTKPKNNISIPKATTKPNSNISIPKTTTKPENIPSIPKNITGQTASPKHTTKPKYTVKPDNLITKPKQSSKPKETPLIPKQTANPKNTPFANPSQSPGIEATVLYPISQIPPLEEHFLELQINTSYQLTINDSTPVIWSSTNPEIVSVEAGQIKVHKSGTAVIYCHYPNTERGSSCFVFSS